MNKKQLTDHMKLNNKQDQSVDASVLLRKGNKIIMGERGREGGAPSHAQVQAAKTCVGESMWDSKSLAGSLEGCKWLSRPAFRKTS